MDQRKRTGGDDDGRTIADMSGIDRPAMFRPQRSRRDMGAPEAGPEQPQELLSPEERRIYIFAALKAALLIAFAFIGGLGLVTWLLILLWT